MMLFYNNNNQEGRIQDEEFVQLGTKHGIPTLNDAAADVPPVENLWKYTAMGFDLVAFSGGKGIRGPQSAGLLARPEGARSRRRAMNGSPNGNAIGRGMKVNKEEMVGMLAALELFVRQGSRARGAGVRRRAEEIREGAAVGAGRQGRGLRARGRQPRAARARDVGRRVEGRSGRGGRATRCRTESRRSRSDRKERHSSSASG